MATLKSPPEGYPPEIIGYVEPWITNPGSTIDVKISSTVPEYTYQIVRLVHGPQDLDTPLRKQEVISEIPSGTCKGRYQVANIGSYGIVEAREYHVGASGLEVSLYFQPHLPEAKHTQAIVSTLDVAAKTGYAAVLTDEGFVEFWVGTRATVEVVRTGFKPVLKQWVQLRFTIKGSSLHYEICPKSSLTEVVEPPSSGSRDLKHDPDLDGPCTVLFAASFAQSPEMISTDPTDFFNGRIDSPMLRTACSSKVILAQWYFQKGIPTEWIFDVSGGLAHGRLVNAPTRAVTGHDWDGTESDWTKAAHGYGAIHFHEDDLDDAAWATDFSVDIPDTLRSGVYAVEIESLDGKARDTVPFFIRPTEESSTRLGARAAYIISTFTYLAYANEHVFDRKHLRQRPRSWDIRMDEHVEKTARRNDLGLSCYDVYNDRSGVIHTSAKRPILNMRPDYISWNFHRPRGLSADMIMLEFLERTGIPYDVVCDHDLHELGKGAIDRYGTIITGSHPEYHSVESLSAYRHFIQGGGNVMYLGGNGFYWSAATQSQSIHRMEVRRGDQGVSAFQNPGGERVFSANGQQGLLWRSRGMPANRLFGVGCCGQGLGAGPGVPYKRTDAGKSPALSWMFEGISSDELIGVHGLGGGASGDEIDRCDYGIGSPSNTVVVATSTGHPDTFCLFPEDADFPLVNTLGTQTPKVRSDITYYESSGGGAVFSIGSINWFCSLGWDDFQNNVARLTENVLRDFVSRS